MKTKRHFYAEKYRYLMYIFCALIFILYVATCKGQISGQIRAGYSIKTNDPIIAPAVCFKAHGLGLTPELIIHAADNQPGDMGVKISYEREIWKVSVEAGYGRYFNLYSTDKYDSYRNGWSNLWFASVHYKKFFVEYGSNTISFGMREAL